MYKAVVGLCVKTKTKFNLAHVSYFKCCYHGCFAYVVHFYIIHVQLLQTHVLYKPPFVVHKYIWFVEYYLAFLLLKIVFSSYMFTIYIKQEVCFQWRRLDCMYFYNNLMLVVTSQKKSSIKSFLSIIFKAVYEID